MVKFDGTLKSWPLIYCIKLSMNKTKWKASFEFEANFVHILMYVINKNKIINANIFCSL